jgi:hypothetical protein
MRRPSFQFRLSTLLWITLAVACWFGGVAWNESKVAKEREQWKKEHAALQWKVNRLESREPVGDQLLRRLFDPNGTLPKDPSLPSGATDDAMTPPGYGHLWSVLKKAIDQIEASPPPLGLRELDEPSP